VDLADLAHQADVAEQDFIAEGKDSGELAKYIAGGSRNMDDSGFFSVQVLSMALMVFGLTIVPIGSTEVKDAKENPARERGFILNLRNHWFTIRKFGPLWFNLNSTQPHPEVVSPIYLGMLLKQLQIDGYSVFVIKGDLPQTQADGLAITLAGRCNLVLFFFFSLFSND